MSIAELLWAHSRKSLLLSPNYIYTTELSPNIPFCRIRFRAPTSGDPRLRAHKKGIHWNSRRGARRIHSDFRERSAGGRFCV